MSVHPVAISDLVWFSLWFQLLKRCVSEHFNLQKAAKYRQPENGLLCTPFLNEISEFGVEKYRHKYRTT